jgi:hypothetical protein
MYDIVNAWMCPAGWKLSQGQTKLLEVQNKVSITGLTRLGLRRLYFVVAHPQPSFISLATRAAN